MSRRRANIERMEGRKEERDKKELGRGRVSEARRDETEASFVKYVFLES